MHISSSVISTISSIIRMIRLGITKGNMETDKYTDLDMKTSDIFVALVR